VVPRSSAASFFFSLALLSPLSSVLRAQNCRESKLRVSSSSQSSLTARPLVACHDSAASSLSSHCCLASCSCSTAVLSPPGCVVEVAWPPSVVVQPPSSTTVAHCSLRHHLLVISAPTSCSFRLSEPKVVAKAQPLAESLWPV